MSTVDEADRLRTELELDLNRFLLVKSLLERGDVKGAAHTAGVAIARLGRVVGPSQESHRDDTARTPE